MKAKKQVQSTINPQQMPDMVQTHKMKEVAPPQDALRGADGKYSIDKAVAAQKWFKAAKGDDPSAGFLGVPAQSLDPKEATDREMLVKKKK
jgi:hypothetical protein